MGQCIHSTFVPSVGFLLLSRYCTFCGPIGYVMGEAGASVWDLIYVVPLASKRVEISK